jgi:serine/threonine-protein kinase HipA
MTSEPTSAYVWIWLPGATEPVVCGRLDDEGGRIAFVYARSYLGRPEAVPIFEPELPLQRGEQSAASGTRLPLCIDDAMPDAWGRRLVQYRRGELTAELGELTYLLESGTDHVGALDFQESPTEYVPRGGDRPSLDDLATAAAQVERGEVVEPSLAAALLHGTSIGGARPKALLTDDQAGDDARPRALIAKFSSTGDTYPVVQGEFVAMELARRCGLDVAPVELTTAAGRRVLLVERFDRHRDGSRRRVVSALTVLSLTPFPEGRYATYVDLAHRVRAQFTSPSATLRELFGRISFNILCSNTDDHGRNHAALVEPEGLVLSPAYDVCPQARSGTEARQAMAFGAGGAQESRVALLIEAAGSYLLDRTEAEAIVEAQIEVITTEWEEVCDLAELTTLERDSFWGRQFLNPFALS